jgi:probable F420-dependent oxidoreductase
MQFGVVLHVSTSWADWDTFSSIARKAEQLGYDSVLVSDHFLSPNDQPHALEAWTALSALASFTSRIKLGTYVLCNQFRHPSLLAKAASTLDNISKGRLELAIGAGWLKDEHTSFGFNWGKLSTRIERLRESIEIIKKLWTENNVSYEGKHFQLKNATLEPKPLQRPHPPLWIGGSSNGILKLIGELGDGWVPVLPTPKQLEEGLSRITEIMRKARRDPESLKVAYGGSGCAIIAETEEQVAELAEPLLRSSGKPISESPCIIGTPERCIGKIEQYRKAGAQRIVAGFYDFPSTHGLELFAKSVIPSFK